MNLTGKTRYRPHIVSGRWNPSVVLLVLQVEYHNPDFAASPSPTQWRDATVEDLAELERIKEKS